MQRFTGDSQKTVRRRRSNLEPLRRHRGGHLEQACAPTRRGDICKFVVAIAIPWPTPWWRKMHCVCAQRRCLRGKIRGRIGLWVASSKCTRTCRGALWTLAGKQHSRREVPDSKVGPGTHQSEEVSNNECDAPSHAVDLGIVACELDLWPKEGASGGAKLPKKKERPATPPSAPALQKRGRASFKSRLKRAPCVDPCQ